MKKRHYSRPIIVLCVLLLAAGPMLWLRGLWLREQRQYFLDWHLAEAMTRTDTKAALALVHAGANPNVPGTLSRSTTLIDQYEYLIGNKRLPIDLSDSVFMYVCSMDMQMITERGVNNSVEDEDIPLLRAMITYGADVRLGNCNGITPLHLAVCANRPRVVELLLQCGADINVQDIGGRTPLIMATSQDHLEVMRVLLEHGANPNIANDHGWTAMSYADNKFSGSQKRVPLLLAHGANAAHTF